MQPGQVHSPVSNTPSRLHQGNPAGVPSRTHAARQQILPAQHLHVALHGADLSQSATATHGRRARLGAAVDQVEFRCRATTPGSASARDRASDGRATAKSGDGSCVQHPAPSMKPPQVQALHADGWFVPAPHQQAGPRRSGQAGRVSTRSCEAADSAGVIVRLSIHSGAICAEESWVRQFDPIVAARASAAGQRRRRRGVSLCRSIPAAEAGGSRSWGCRSMRHRHWKFQRQAHRPRGRRRGTFTLRVRKFLPPSSPSPVSRTDDQLASLRAEPCWPRRLAVLLLGIWATPKSPLTRHAGMKPLATQGLIFWSLAFLPDGRMLVTERPGRLRVVQTDSTLGPPIAGLPRVGEGGEGGLLDVTLDPRFESNRLICWSYAEPAPDAPGAPRHRRRARPPRRRSEEVPGDLPPARQGQRRPLRLPAAVRRAGLPARRPGRSRRTPRRAEARLRAHGKILRIGSTARQRRKPVPGDPGALGEIWCLGCATQGLAFEPVTTSGRPTMAPGRRRDQHRARAQLRLAGGHGTERFTRPRSARGTKQTRHAEPRHLVGAGVGRTERHDLPDQRGAIPAGKDSCSSARSVVTRWCACASRAPNDRRAAAPGDRVAGAHPAMSGRARWMALHPHRRP